MNLSLSLSIFKNNQKNKESQLKPLKRLILRGFLSFPIVSIKGRSPGGSRSAEKTGEAKSALVILLFPVKARSMTQWTGLEKRTRNYALLFMPFRAFNALH